MSAELSAELTAELEIAKTIARMAASVCQAIQAEMVTGAHKTNHEPVTIADYASQAVIGNGLAENFPDDGVISEERSEEFMLLLSDPQRLTVQHFVEDAIGGYVFDEQVCAWLDFGKQREAERQWVIDPIDGTKGFLSQRHYCVAVALLVRHEPVLGILASPAFYGDDTPWPDEASANAGAGVLTYALRGHGAFMEPLFGGERQPIRVSDGFDPRAARVLTSFESGHTDTDLIGAVAARLGRSPEAPVRRLDSQDKHAQIAAGVGDVYLRLVPEPTFREKLWDHAAGYVIVTEAGGRMTDMRGAALDWSLGARMEHNRGVLVTNGHLHAAFADAIAAIDPG